MYGAKKRRLIAEQDAAPGAPLLTGFTLLNQTFQRDKSESFNDLSSAVIPKQNQIQMK